MSISKNNVEQFEETNVTTELKDLQEEIARLRKELEDKEWASRKTNEGIKTLYKELEKKNKELKKLNQLKSDFISMVSHELRTPLATVKEGIDLILDRITGEINKKQERTLTIAKNNIDRLARIINDLLDISRIEAGRIKLEKRRVNITHLIKQVVSSFASSAQEKGLQLRVDLPKKDIVTYADTDKMAEVFTNLVSNGLKFTEKGYIQIFAQEKRNEIECSVADTGIGIPKDELPGIFTRFRQFGRVMGVGEKGTGLGLSITKWIIDIHRGKIWVESKLGKGTKFTFTLPRYTPKLPFKKYINKRIKEAMENNTKISLVTISIADLDKLEYKMPIEKIDSILNDMRDVLESSLRMEKDVVVKKIGEIVAILADCGKEGASSVETRMRQALQKYLVREKLAKKIKLRLGHVTYPDEGRLLKK